MSILLQTVLAQSAAAARAAREAAEAAPTPIAPPEPWGWQTWGVVVLGIVVVALVFTWGAVRFWLMATRPPLIPDVHTPTLDRLNERALAHMGEEGEEEDVEAPSDLLAVVPDEQPRPDDARPG